ncbi:unnamed protein product, partial [Medioppia subpectinata]
MGATEAKYPTINNQLTRKNVINHGSFGTVYRVTDNTFGNTTKFAVKVVKVKGKEKNKWIKSIREVDIMKSMYHKNVCQYFDSWSTSNRIYIKMQLCHCTLDDLLLTKHQINCKSDSCQAEFVYKTPGICAGSPYHHPTISSDMYSLAMMAKEIFDYDFRTMSSSSNTDGNATQELDSEEMDPQVLPQLIGKKPIGKGRFGEVYKVDIKGAPNPYAVKVITKVVKGEEDRDAKEREMVFKNEYRSLGLMTKLSHQHVVPIIKTLCTNEPDTVYIQMQFCACNLRELINTKNSMFGRPDLSESKNNYPYTEPNDLEYFISLCWLREITLGLQYLHSKSIIHRDVKPENIVMGTLGDVGDTRWVLKLGDFGLAKLYQASRNNTNDVGTPKYMAPELAMARYTLKADLYSVGIVMPELFNYR